MVFGAAYDVTTVPGAGLLELSFAPGVSLSYSGTTTGQSLTINGQAYALIYSMTDLAGMSGQDGDYALATTLTSTTAFSAPVVASFGGTFEGLGNTIANLTINDPTDPAVGLFDGICSCVVLRDVGLTGANVVGGSGAAVGALVGDSSGIVANAYATGSVSGGFVVGGLVGFNDGAIVNAYATATVSGTSAAAAGGLAGLSDFLIENAYATGSVSGPGGANGGLVGVNLGGLFHVYAMGAVSGGGSGSAAGGLVGVNETLIARAYATGAVSGLSGDFVGGLVGLNDLSALIRRSYWDTSTNAAGLTDVGSNSGFGSAVGETTAALQAGLPSGFSSAVWGVIPGTSFPYLLSQYPTPPQVVSGIAYADAGVTPLASQSGIVATNQAPGVVFAAADGTSLGSVNTGANGFYYFLAPAGTIKSIGSNVIAYTNAANNAPGAQNGATVVAGATGSQTSLNIDGGWLVEETPASISSLSAALTAAQSAPPSGALTPITGFASNIEIAFASAGFTIDQATSTTGTFVLNGGGDVTQTAAGSNYAGALLMEGGGTFALTNANNAFATLAAKAIGVAVVDNQALRGQAPSSGAATSATTTGDLSRRGDRRQHRSSAAAVRL